MAMLYRLGAHEADLRWPRLGEAGTCGPRRVFVRGRRVFSCEEDTSVLRIVGEAGRSAPDCIE